MKTIVTGFSILENFWEVNPNLLTIPEFKKLYDNDKTKNKNHSSTIMWAVAAAEDLNPANPYRHLVYEDKIKVIEENILKKINVKFEEVEEYVDVYKKYCMSTIDIMINAYKRRLEDRIQMIESTLYSTENAKMIDELLLKTTTLYTEFNRLMELAEKENIIDTKVKGGRLESISEEGLI